MLKKRMKQPAFLVLLASLFLILGACSNANDGTKEKTKDMKLNGNKSSSEMKMDHDGSMDVPKGLKAAKNPKYAVGMNAIIESDHMEGMRDAEATIVGAYDTTVYAISYTPTTGGERVENHKWVIHEEIQDAGNEPFKQGTEVTINADHMEGMNEATAEIDSAQKTTVYMVDFTTTDGETVKNHKWVTEDELSPLK